MKFKAHKLIGIGIFVYIVYKINCLQVIKILSHSDPFWLMFAFCLSIPHILLKSMRWKYILKIQGYNLNLKDTFLYYLSGIYLGMITPGRLGELSRAMYLKQSGIVKTLSRSFSSVIIDRLFDLYALFTFSMLGIIYFNLEQVSAWWGWCGIGLCVVIPFLFYNKKFSSFISNYISKKIQKIQTIKHTKRYIDDFTTDILLLKNFKLLIAGIFTILSYMFFFVQCTLIALALAIPVNYFEISFGMAIANFFSMFPITIAGLGTRESALYFFLGPNGVTFDAVMAYSLCVLVVFYLGGAVLGLISWWLKPLYFGTESHDK